MAINEITELSVTGSVTTVYETGNINGHEKTYTLEIQNTGSTYALTDFRLESLSLAGGTSWTPVLNGTSSNDWVVANGFVHHVVIFTTSNPYDPTASSTIPTIGAGETGRVTFTIPKGHRALRFRAHAESGNTTINFYIGEES